LKCCVKISRTAAYQSSAAAGKDQRPALRRVHPGAERLGPSPWRAKVTVLDLHASLPLASGHQPYLDLACGVAAMN
jgi:hypothetical protein